ncbi:unnamed protein product [Gongylonema pulchrum]|uniref:Rab3 GTPase-activating protein catalytic subunit n=1 Tax=Gongylonema pulchrum TaxID=637853 RepID=A0A183E8K2_9BILA|nr:unnamed protein product [Gongylonema pulchrum]
MNLNEQSSQIPIQLDTNGFAITCLDISVSKQCIAFGDQTGLIHLFSDRMEPVFNENAWPTEFPNPITLHPAVNIDDTEPPYAIFPLPFPADDHYASDWPEQLCLRRQSDPVPQKVMESMRMVQFVGYAHNPRADTLLRGFNVCPYTTSAQDKCFMNMVKVDQAVRIPKFYLHCEGWPASNAEETNYKRYNRTEFNTIACYDETNPACMLLLVTLTYLLGT